MDEEGYEKRRFGEEYFDHVKGLFSLGIMCIGYLLGNKKEEDYNDRNS